MQTFINVPPLLESAIAKILADSNTLEMHTHAKLIHDRYMKPDRSNRSPLLRNAKDMIAYLSLRFPATYAQIASALLQIHERLPAWQPKRILDLGCGPGTGIFAATSLWPSITHATALDQEKYFISLGKELVFESKQICDISWSNESIAHWVDISNTDSYDLVIVANVVNELSTDTKNKLLDMLAHMKNGVVLLLEPGTQQGFEIIQSAAGKISPDQPLIAPYIQNTYIKSDSYWIHFPQRFKRPEFQRRVRQSMRDTSLPSSDWEETKFTYVAFGNTPTTLQPYALCIGSVELYHGYLMLPLLTAYGIEKVKIMKRHKTQYRFGKNLTWGETIMNASDITYTSYSLNASDRIKHHVIEPQTL